MSLSIPSVRAPVLARPHFEATPWPPVKRSTSSMECTTWVSFSKGSQFRFQNAGILRLQSTQIGLGSELSDALCQRHTLGCYNNPEKCVGWDEIINNFEAGPTDLPETLPNLASKTSTCLPFRGVSLLQTFPMRWFSLSWFCQSLVHSQRWIGWLNHVKS